MFSCVHKYHSCRMCVYVLVCVYVCTRVICVYKCYKVIIALNRLTDKPGKTESQKVCLFVHISTVVLEGVYVFLCVCVCVCVCTHALTDDTGKTENQEYVHL